MEGRHTGQGRWGGNVLCLSLGSEFLIWLSPHLVSSVHPASTFPAIQGASLPALTTQPSPLVSGGFPPPEEETHSQPVNPHSLHHLHAAYRVGERTSLSALLPAVVPVALQRTLPLALHLFTVGSGGRLG